MSKSSIINYFLVCYFIVPLLMFMSRGIVLYASIIVDVSIDHYYVMQCEYEAY